MGKKVVPTRRYSLRAEPATANSITLPPLMPRTLPSGPHPDHEHEANRAEDHARHPRGEVGWDQPLSSDRLRELNEHQENDRGGKADADSVGRATALGARGKGSAKEGDNEAGCRNRDLESPLYPHKIRVASGALLGANEPCELRIAHLFGAARLRHHLDGTLREMPIAQAVEAHREAHWGRIRHDFHVTAGQRPVAA